MKDTHSKLMKKLEKLATQFNDTLQALKDEEAAAKRPELRFLFTKPQDAMGPVRDTIDDILGSALRKYIEEDILLRPGFTPDLAKAINWNTEKSTGKKRHFTILSDGHAADWEGIRRAVVSLLAEEPKTTIDFVSVLSDDHKGPISMSALAYQLKKSYPGVTYTNVSSADEGISAVVKTTDQRLKEMRAKPKKSRALKAGI